MDQGYSAREMENTDAEVVGTTGVLHPQEGTSQQDQEGTSQQDEEGALQQDQEGTSQQDQKSTSQHDEDTLSCNRLDLHCDNLGTVDSQTKDTSDAWNRGFGYPVICQVRASATLSVGPQSPNYNMKHDYRGLALIIAYENFKYGRPPRRDCAKYDVQICKKAFSHLRFEVKEYWHEEKSSLLEILKQVSKEDHSNRDALAVVFMSHGGVDEKTNKEFVNTYDDKMNTSELWKYFTAEKCPSLAGKPKMFFIQACRGEETDKGIQLKSKRRGMPIQTDSVQGLREEDYVIPLHADMLIMWASYPGMFAFKSKNNGMHGSVFLHYLSQVFSSKDAFKDDLATMLLCVTRLVATDYESYNPNDRMLHQNKQIPYTTSTLMRKIYFFEE
ncbi:caspase-1-like isoform X1 [Homarus americanus]|uniref:caspase-1-like isoform X1 n=1 Tax=Homarus americanus TaxID=6706 RepID=UPI001C487AD1|nr:caspase-1-like isoform X1 [Homarus americanus]XP_042239953.1 caspase-1-like isoform X1 [Homarus americanus]